MTAAACDVQLAVSEVQDVCGHLEHLDTVGADMHADAGGPTVECGVLKPTSLLPGAKQPSGASPPKRTDTENNCIIDRSSCTTCRASVATVHVVMLSCLLGFAMVRPLRTMYASTRTIPCVCEAVDTVSVFCARTGGTCNVLWHQMMSTTDSCR